MRQKGFQQAHSMQQREIIQGEVVGGFGIKLEQQWAQQEVWVHGSGVWPTVDVVMHMLMAAFDFDRYQIDLAVAHAAFGGNLFCQRAHTGRRAAQEQGFQAIIVIEVNVHAGDDQVMRVVLQIGQPFG
jgi:hypothetical protein